MQHLQIKAQHNGTKGIWTIVQFATGQNLSWYTSTDSSGFWQTDFKVPRDTISKYSHQAVVTFQLWKGNLTAKSFANFTVIP